MDVELARVARWRGSAGVALAVGLVLTLTACGGGGDSPVDRARARVTAAEKSVAEASSAADDASEEFCTAGTDYVRALDRYGDLLTSTPTTVGDVVSAGSDLAEPREDALDAGRAASEARQDLADAQNELFDAQAQLAAAQASESGVPAPSPTTTPATPAPIAPDATVARVKQADTEFAAAQEGISPSTPLVEAGQQFNAAAVALEVAWLKLVADSGCLSDEQQVQGEAQVRAYTSALQQQLADAGYYTATVDGIYGPATVAAVEALQQAHGLPVTGTVDAATQTALAQDLAAKGGAAAQATTAATAALQQTLKLVGYWDGPVDGQPSQALTDALSKLQTDLGVPVTGVVDAATIAAFEAELALVGVPDPAPSASEATPTP